MVMVLRKIDSLPQKMVELSQSLSTMKGEIQRLDGCIECNFYQDASNTLSFLWVEKWESRNKREDHIISDQFSILLGAIQVLCECSVTEILTIDHFETSEFQCN
jgi:quinol monooxygenase YgiN